MGADRTFVGQLTHDVRNGLNALELQLTFLGEISTDPEAVDGDQAAAGTLTDITRQLQALQGVDRPRSSAPVEYPAERLLRRPAGALRAGHTAAVTRSLERRATVSLLGGSRS